MARVTLFNQLSAETGERTEAVVHELTTVVITREYIISLLRAWRQNEITTIDLYSTVSNLWGLDAKLLDEEGEGEYSATWEVIAYLDCLDMDFITQEDIEPAIEFLHTPIGHLDEGRKKWEKYKHLINIEERIKKLNGQFPYIYDERYPKA